MDIYCVVTGQNERGKSVFVQMKPIQPVSLSPVVCFLRANLCFSSKSLHPESPGATISFSFDLGHRGLP